MQLIKEKLQSMPELATIAHDLINAEEHPHNRGNLATVCMPVLRLLSTSAPLGLWQMSPAGALFTA